MGGMVVPSTTHKIKNAIKTVRVNGSNGCRCRYLPSHSLALSLPLSLPLFPSRFHSVQKENSGCYHVGLSYHGFWFESELRAVCTFWATGRISNIWELQMIIWRDNGKNI